jgi:uncharacterized protein YodC (DUF2158 family)
MSKEVVHKFKRGDEVRLKSGGPIMTTLEYERGHDIAAVVYGNRAPSPSRDTEIVYCQWFDDKNKLQGAKFQQDHLLDLFD